MKFTLDRNFESSIDTICKKCGQWKSECVCGKVMIKTIEKNLYKVKKKLIKVKNKTISSFYPIYDDNYEEVLKKLKKKLGCGGNAEIIDDYITINLQGDVVEKAAKELANMGFNIS